MGKRRPWSLGRCCFSYSAAGVCVLCPGRKGCEGISSGRSASTHTAWKSVLLLENSHVGASLLYSSLAAHFIWKAFLLPLCHPIASVLSLVKMRQMSTTVQGTLLQSSHEAEHRCQCPEPWVPLLSVSLGWGLGVLGTRSSLLETGMKLPPPDGVPNSTSCLPSQFLDAVHILRTWFLESDFSGADHCLPSYGQGDLG